MPHLLSAIRYLHESQITAIGHLTTLLVYIVILYVYIYIYMCVCVCVCMCVIRTYNFYLKISWHGMRHIHVLVCNDIQRKINLVLHASQCTVAVQTCTVLRGRYGPL
jgi:hypothetical protein